MICSMRCGAIGASFAFFKMLKAIEFSNTIKGGRGWARRNSFKHDIYIQHVHIMTAC